MHHYEVKLLASPASVCVCGSDLDVNRGGTCCAQTQCQRRSCWSVCEEHGAQVTAFPVLQDSQFSGAEEQHTESGSGGQLFIEHFWPTWQQEGDEDKEGSYGGQRGRE